MIKLKKLNIEYHVLNEGNLHVKQDTHYTLTDFWINPSLIVSIMPVNISIKNASLEVSRIETSNQMILVLGTPDQIREQIIRGATLLKG